MEKKIRTLVLIATGLVVGVAVERVSIKRKSELKPKKIITNSRGELEITFQNTPWVLVCSKKDLRFELRSEEMPEISNIVRL